jgi:GNAT superfamily N-acetyltransferase
MGLGEFSPDDLTFKPVTIEEWEELRLLFAEPGVHHGCWCMYWRIRRSDFNSQYGEGNEAAMKRIVESGRVPGILAYLRGRPVGWCSVAPRQEFPVLNRSRTLRRVDDRPVWSIVCFFVSSQYRRKGVSRALLRAAIGYAAGQGAKIVEAYPLLSEGAKAPPYETYMGLLSTFEEAGFREVARRSKRRCIVRYGVQPEG